jgi:hypothetical protein
LGIIILPAAFVFQNPQHSSIISAIEMNVPLPFWLKAHPDGVVLALKVQPRASRNEICGESGGELRIRVTAPPVDAAANEAIIRLLAETLDWPRSKVELVRGHSSRHKTIMLRGAAMSVVASKLTA